MKQKMTAWVYVVRLRKEVAAARSAQHLDRLLQLLALAESMQRGRQ